MTQSVTIGIPTQSVGTRKDFTYFTGDPREPLLINSQKRACCFEEIAQKQAIPDKNKTAKKLYNQIKPLAVNVTACWLWVNENLQALKIDAILRIWIIGALLPVVYWHHQLHKTQNTLFREKYQRVWESSSKILRAHPLLKGERLLIENVSQGSRHQ